MGLLACLGLRRRDAFDNLTLIDHLLSPLTLLVSLFYRLVLLLRGAPFHPPRNKPPVRVVCISDTHDHIVDVPAGDILIHAGDLTIDGSAHSIQKQLDWLKSLSHQVKVVVAGNHDGFFDANTHSDGQVRPRDVLDLAGLLYLQGDLTVQEVKGRRLAIFGAPDIPECGPSSFAFQYTPARQPWFSRIPPQTDILVTHSPPKYHLDLGNGCPHLLREVWRVKPRLHVFGHVHCAYGSEPAYFDHLQLAYERLLSRPRRGPICDLVTTEAWLDVLRVLFHGVHSVLWKWFMGGPGSNHGGLMVNAAQMYKNSGRVKSRAVVVDI
ncbi:calcineurin-like phosphoesterase [Hirsutella rhossiliensis]|uniref:Calcineurin-like phosphoesterase domain-containing protein n=1 Tax=Hirsutella rhossiliensis TaxID=111463 RepID=A0A9P8N729_9HYPO|nr:calcineurin-like phosphoesterase domain-containing protein [Hirsutella rhossiliensis]KAH0965832.1 calcineurin-like phosphoesterase domain-containing protein [Hirsutella rhossiliensis]